MKKLPKLFVILFLYFVVITCIFILLYQYNAVLQQKDQLSDVQEFISLLCSPCALQYLTFLFMYVCCPLLGFYLLKLKRLNSCS